MAGCIINSLTMIFLFIYFIGYYAHMPSMLASVPKFNENSNIIVSTKWLYYELF